MKIITVMRWHDLEHVEPVVCSTWTRQHTEWVTGHKGIHVGYQCAKKRKEPVAWPAGAATNLFLMMDGINLWQLIFSLRSHMVASLVKHPYPVSLIDFFARVIKVWKAENNMQAETAKSVYERCAKACKLKCLSWPMGSLQQVVPRGLQRPHNCVVVVYMGKGKRETTSPYSRFQNLFLVMPPPCRSIQTEMAESVHEWAAKAQIEMVEAI